MAPTSTEKGSSRSVSCGTRKNEAFATIQADTFGASEARRMNST